MPDQYDVNQLKQLFDVQKGCCKWELLFNVEQMLCISTSKSMLRSHGRKQWKTLENYQKSMFFNIRMRGSCRAHVEKW